MSLFPQPFHLLVVALAGWINRNQQAVIDYLIEENRVLKDQLEGRRLRFTDEQRIRLAVKAKAVGRRLLKEIETIVTPDTLLAWHRKLIKKNRSRTTITNASMPYAMRTTYFMFNNSFVSNAMLDFYCN